MLVGLIIVIFVVIAIIIYNAFLPKIKENKLYESLVNYLDKNNITYKIERKKNAIYDVDLIIGTNRYYIKILIVPEYSEIQINNRSTWELKYGAGSTPGKAQPHKRYLNEISSFQSACFEDEIIKLVLVSPKPKQIVKYINESEIITVNSKTDIYGSRIITKDNFVIFKK